MASEYYVINTITEQRVSKAIPRYAECERLAGLLNATMSINKTRATLVYGIEEYNMELHHTIKVHTLKGKAVTV